MTQLKPATIRMVVGLGNPGARYVGTRHNIGFEVVEKIFEIALREGAVREKWRGKFGGELASIDAARARIDQAADARKAANSELVEWWLFKPQSFMNLSGGPVREATDFFKISPDEVAVVHDDIDLPMGAIRIKRGGGDGGHNGLKSISTELGTREYLRVRVGVGRPQSADGESFEHSHVSDWVLGKFGDSEREQARELLEQVAKAVWTLSSRGLESAQRVFNRS